MSNVSMQDPDASKADKAKAAASDTAGSAAEQGQAVAQTAASQAQDVASHARDQVGTVATEARQQAQKVMSSTTSEVQSHLEQRLGNAASSARSTAGELRALVEGRPHEAGRTADLARQATDRLERMADRVDDLGVQGILDETSDFARRRPAAFLAGAVAAGFVAGRLARAGKEVQSSSSSTASTSTSTQFASSAPTPGLPAASGYGGELTGVGTGVGTPSTAQGGGLPPLGTDGAVTETFTDPYDAGPGATGGGMPR